MVTANMARSESRTLQSKKIVSGTLLSVTRFSIRGMIVIQSGGSWTLGHILAHYSLGGQMG